MPEEWPRPTPPDLDNRPGEQRRIKRPNRAVAWMIAAVVLILLFIFWWWMWGKGEETNTNTNTNEATVEETVDSVIENTTNSNKKAVEEAVEEGMEMTNTPIPELIIEESVPTGP